MLLSQKNTERNRRVNLLFVMQLRSRNIHKDQRVLTRYKRLEQYPDDQELLDDVIVENKQAIEMTTIYRDIKLRNGLKAASSF
mgnify:CR=1 FL=1